MRQALLFFTLLLTIPAFPQPYRNLVFEGGGIRGVAYAGALNELESAHAVDSLQKIAGTSVGAIAATLYAVGYNAFELEDILFDLKIQRFNDGRWIFLGGFHRLSKNFGWYRGQALEEWIGKLVEKRTGNAHISFRQLHELSKKDRKFHDLYVTATNLTRQQQTIFSYELFPDMEIKTAVRASISIPLYFSAVFLDDKGAKLRRPKAGDNYEVYVDGGILANYPLTIFDSAGKPGETLGLKLERPEQLDWYKQSRDIAPYDIDDFKSYVGAFYNIIIEHLNRSGSPENEAARTIYISTGHISPKVRKIKKAEKELLYANGVKAARSFLDKKKGR